MRSIEEIRDDFNRIQEEKRLRPTGTFISRVLRKLRVPEVPSLKLVNDYGDREISVYSGPIVGIDRITKFMHYHKTGRLPINSGQKQPASSDSLRDPAR